MLRNAYGAMLLFFMAFCYVVLTLCELFLLHTYDLFLTKLFTLWFSYVIYNFVCIERIQCVFTYYIASFLHLSYARRLSVFSLETFSVRVKKFKLIMLFQIVQELIDIDLVLLNLSITADRTRANDIHFILPTPHTNMMYHSLG